MYWSKLFIPTLKEASRDAESISHKLMLRAGLIRMLSSGVYLYLPLGLKVLRNIESIIREEMASVGAQELLLSCLQPLDVWKRTGRDKDMSEIMIKFLDRKKKEMCLGPTHEEVITDLVAKHVNSYRNLPLVLYQIQTKFRDEIRPRFGLVRSSEFIMKDAYSFDKDEAGLNKNYELMLSAYKRIFTRCGLSFLSLEADCGVMGGSLSHEFMVPAESGEDIVFRCNKCGFTKGQSAAKEKDICPKCSAELEKISTIEVGHIFKLGTKYSKVLGARFLDREGKLQDIIMGCYGIGVSRLIAAIIEQNHDKYGIIWPKEISPFSVLISIVNTANTVLSSLAEEIKNKFASENISFLCDDRDEYIGIKFKDADLIGVPIRITLGDRFIKENKIEIKERNNPQVTTVDKDNLIEAVKKML